MNVLNASLTELMCAVLSPFRGWSPLAVLIILSALLGIVMAVVFRFTSNQRRLRRVADRCRAEVLAIKLFKDEPATMFHALVQLMRYTGQRLWYSLPPMLVMMAPIVLLLVQLALWYEYRPLEPGEAAIVELQLADSAWTQYNDVAPVVPPQIAVETGPLRDKHEHAIFWRIRASQPIPADIRWELGSRQFAKHISIASQGEAFDLVSVRRPGPGWWDRLLHPGEPAFDAASPVRGIEVYYQHRDTPLFGWNVPWWGTLLIVSMLSALLVRPLAKVQF